MKRHRRVVALVAALAVGALALGGVAVARGVSDGDEQVRGPAAEQASAAALAFAGGGTVLEVERQDGDGAGLYEVEVRRADGSTVEVHVDAQFTPVGSAADDDGAGSENDREETGSER